MVTIDTEKCRKCGVCIRIFNGYCVTGEGGAPHIDYALCNQCQKCISICPHQAILNSGHAPDRLTACKHPDSAELLEFMRRRRSCKRFRDEKIPRETLQAIASAASFAPNQNKNIEIIAVDDNDLIGLIDRAAMKTVRRWYALLFSVKPLTRFFMFISKSLPVIKKKMEYDLLIKKHVVKENAACLFLLTGDTRVPVTETSAQYLLANMILCAEALGVGSCLMDSVKMSLNQSNGVKKELGIPAGWKVLGVLAAGYSAEPVVNIPRGYEVPVSWNSMQPSGVQKKRQSSRPS